MNFFIVVGIAKFSFEIVPPSIRYVNIIKSYTSGKTEKHSLIISLIAIQAALVCEVKITFKVLIQIEN